MTRCIYCNVLEGTMHAPDCQVGSISIDLDAAVPVERKRKRCAYCNGVNDGRNIGIAHAPDCPVINLGAGDDPTESAFVAINKKLDYVIKLLERIIPPERHMELGVDFGSETIPELPPSDEGELLEMENANETEHPTQEG